MSIFTYLQEKKFYISFLFCLLVAYASIVSATTLSNPKTKTNFTPPPIPPVNTLEFKEYVRKNHTFPSPFGFEPYRDQYGIAQTFLINELNRINPYIPVTFYCNSRKKCPTAIIAASGNVMFKYPDNSYVTLGVNGHDDKHRAMVAFYYPNDPKLYSADISFKQLDANTRKGSPLVTILFSQSTLTYLSEYVKGKWRGNLTANDINIDLPCANGQESIAVGTTLSVVGMGVASGVEFTETVSQMTGESYTQQVQTGFTLGVFIENDATVGGGVVPVSDTFKFGINAALSSMISNALQIDNQTTVSRSYTIKPGINDTYYWAIYQLLYSYRINAPLLEQALNRAKIIWNDDVTFQIGDNQVTQDGQLIGNPLPPQASNLVNDITVGVAVPVDTKLNTKAFSQVIRNSV